MSWLDDVVHEVIVEAKAGGKGFIRGGDGAAPSCAGPADCSRRTTPMKPWSNWSAGPKSWCPPAGEPAARLRPCSRQDSRGCSSTTRRRSARFEALKPSEKWLVVELGETAERLARRYPRDAETMVRQLGPEGLTAVRVFGDDVAEVLAKEGPEGLGVLRKAGRGGWAFFTRDVLPHKKKLAAAGVLAVFLANPEKFADYAGQATEFAVREFARAGIQLASAVGVGAARGLETSIGQTLAAYGLDHPVFRYIGIGLSGLVVVLSLVVVLGIPVRWLFRPLSWLLHLRATVRPQTSKG